jgi:hypothetical protein
MRIFFIILAALASLSIVADELVIIQAVSTTGRSFAIRKGARDGIIINQDSLFTTEKASFSARSIEVGADFSLWKIHDDRGKVPFEKGDYVNYNNSLENIWTEVSRLYLEPVKVATFQEESHWLAKVHYSYAFSESVSETDSSRYEARTGFQFEGAYSRHFSYHWEWSAGLRFDRENSSLSDPSIDIPTQRTLVMGDISYHFERFNRSRNNAYISIGMGYGLSSTTVEESVSSGSALILPVVKVGILHFYVREYSFLVEGTFEAVSTSEAFADSDPQETQVLNTKLGFGIRF